MGSNNIHVAKPCSELYGSNYIKEDADVTIHCEGQQFLCHRAVLSAKSSYFECMFRNEWTENVTGSVTFASDQMKADTLLEVLKYIYAGNKSITPSNFADLLCAGDYLGVLGLETANCVRILSQFGPELIDCLWEALFSSEPKLFNESFIRVLASCNLTERLKRFFNKEDFLRISAHHLFIIVTKLWRAPPTMNDILLDAIHRWGAHALDEREEQARELHKLLESNSENSFKLCGISSESCSRVGPDLVKMVAAPKNPSLYIYSKNPGLRTEKGYKMETYRYSCEDPLDKKFVLEHCYQTDLMIRNLRFASVDNVGLFCIANGDKKDYSDFSVLLQFASKDIHQSALALTPPPINLSYYNFDFCNFSDRGLYLLNRRYDYSRSPPRRNPMYNASKEQFSEEEVRRGLFFFNIELDRWLPAPLMKYRPRSCCMTVLDDNMLCMIAGTGSRKSVQAYDHRMRQWQHLPITRHHHYNPHSCVLDGSIYVCSHRHCERYDPLAGKWEDVVGFRPTTFNIQRLISYKSEMCLLWELSGRYFMVVYEPRTATWSTIISGLYPPGPKIVLDAVIW